MEFRSACRRRQSLLSIWLLTLKNATAEEINAALENAANNGLRGILAFCNKPLVSSDFRGDSASSIVDGLSTAALEGKMGKVIAWYDNEWGYSCRIGDLAALIAERGL